MPARAASRPGLRPRVTASAVAPSRVLSSRLSPPRLVIGFAPAADGERSPLAGASPRHGRLQRPGADAGGPRPDQPPASGAEPRSSMLAEARTLGDPARATATAGRRTAARPRAAPIARRATPRRAPARRPARPGSTTSRRTRRSRQAGRVPGGEQSLEELLRDVDRHQAGRAEQPQPDERDRVTRHRAVAAEAPVPARAGTPRTRSRSAARSTAPPSADTNGPAPERAPAWPPNASQ